MWFHYKIHEEKIKIASLCHLRGAIFVILLDFLSGLWYIRLAYSPHQWVKKNIYYRREDMFLDEQQLLTDLAIAERNMKHKSKRYNLLFFNQTSEAFRKTKTRTYFDLVRADVNLAVHLRELAIREKLI